MVAKTRHTWNSYYDSLPEYHKEYLYLFNVVISNIRRDKITFICPIHGLQEKSLLYFKSSKRGCTLCTDIYVKEHKRNTYKVKNVEKTLNRIPSNFRENLDTSEYNGEKLKQKFKVTCLIHSEVFYKSIEKLERCETGCKQCISEKRSENTKINFQEKCKQVFAQGGIFKNLLLIPLMAEDKIRDKTPLLVFCKIHKKWKNSYFNSLTHNKTPCLECRNSVKTKASYFNKKDYIKHYTKLQKDVYLYVCYMNSDNDSFYKVGITSNSVERRYNSNLRKGGHSLTTLFLVKGSPEVIVNLETKLHNYLKDVHYKPKQKFGGSGTECFSDINGILDHIPFDQVEVITDLLSQQEIAV